MTTPFRAGGLGLVAAVLVFVAVFMSNGNPILLYERYRVELGLSTGDLSLTAVVYFLSLLISLLFFGRLSDYVGRRPMAFAAIVMAIASCLVLLHVEGLATLLLGRLMHGVAGGLATSTLGSYVIDLSPARLAWLGPTLASTSVPLGISNGALVTAVFLELDVSPMQAPYLFTAVTLVVAGTLMLLVSPESVVHRPGVSRAMRPAVAVPQQVRHLFPAAAAIFVSTWGLGGFFQAFSPTIAAQSLRSQGALTATALFILFTASYAMGGGVSGRLRAAVAQMAGIIMVAAGMCAVVWGVAHGVTAVVLPGAALAGIGQGMAFTGSIRGLIVRLDQSARAAVMSTVYIVAYGGAAVPTFIFGQLGGVLAMWQIALCFALVTVAAVAVVTFCPRPKELE